MTTTHLRRTLAFAVLAGCTVAACSEGNEVAEITTVAPASAGATPTTGEVVGDTTAVEPTVADTIVVVTTEVVASTVAGSVPSGPVFSDALGVKVASAPGVNTAGDTRQLLPEGLYVHLAWEPDPNDPSVFTVQPDDIEILEAYANASLAYYSAVISTLVTEDPRFSQFMVDQGAQYEQNFAEARKGGYLGSLGNGVVLRPYVLGDQRTDITATILDCYLQDEQFVLAGQQPELSPLEPKGTVATMILLSTGWKVDVIAAEPRACL